MSAPDRSTARRPTDEATSARDLFVFLLGTIGVGLGLVAVLTLGEPTALAVSSWRVAGTAASGAITATLLIDLLSALIRRRNLAWLLVRSALLLVNAVYFVAALLLLVVAASL